MRRPDPSVTMDQDELIDAWRHWKATGSFHRLRAPYTQRYEFRGPQWGHPSNYAAVSFECAPAERLRFTSRAPWPEAMSGRDRERYEAAIHAAVVDGLLSARPRVFCGCALTLVEIGWDDIMSSEMALYAATKVAMTELVAHGPWEHVGPT